MIAKKWKHKYVGKYRMQTLKYYSHKIFLKNFLTRTFLKWYKNSYALVLYSVFSTERKEERGKSMKWCMMEKRVFLSSIYVFLLGKDRNRKKAENLENMYFFLSFLFPSLRNEKSSKEKIRTVWFFLRKKKCFQVFIWKQKNLKMVSVLTDDILRTVWKMNFHGCQSHVSNAVFGGIYVKCICMVEVSLSWALFCFPPSFPKISVWRFIPIILHWHSYQQAQRSCAFLHSEG